MLERGLRAAGGTVTVKNRNRRARGRILAAAIGALGALGAAQFAGAQTTWAGGGSDDLWGTGLNWSTGVAPGATDNVLFGNTDAQTAPGIVNNIVGVSRTISTLTYSNLASVGYHTTQINPGATLSLNYTGPGGNILSVGTSGSIANISQVVATITGGGTLSLSGANGIMMVRQGVNNTLGTGTQTAILDMRGLANFNADINRIAIGAEGTTDGGVNNPNGIVYLAQNNIITTRNGTDGVVIGDAAQNPSTNTSALYLGQTNVINTTRLRVGSRKSSGLLTFQSGLTNPTFTLRGTAGGASRAAAMTIGDNGVLTGATGLTAHGLADFRGGTVDILVDQLAVGRGFNSSATTSSGSADGNLIFDKGVIDANTVWIGYQPNTAGNASGTITLGAGATLIARNDFELARKLSANLVPTGALIVNGGTVNTFTSILDNGGVSTINVNSGVIDFHPGTSAAAASLSTATNPIDNFVLNGSLNNLNNGFVSTISGNGAITGLTGTFTVANASDQTFAGNISGTGGLSKTKDANLTLTGALTYTGPTVVQSGTLTLGATTSLSSSSVIDVRQGATLDASASGGLSLGTANNLSGSGTVNGAVTANGAKVTPGGFNAAGTLNLNNQLTLNGAALAYDLSSDPSTAGSGVNDLLSVGGDLTLTGVNNVSLNALSGTLVSGTYRLIDYSGTFAGGAANFAITGSANGSRRTFTFDTATPGQVNLIIAGSDPFNLVWKGNGTTNRWNINGDLNWNNNVEKFFNLDSVTFDDTGSNTPNVELVGDLAPGAIEVNANQDYTFAGAGRITGGATLNKDGSGKLTFANAGINDFFGAININSGTIEVGAGGTAGTLGTGPINNNALLSFNRSDDLTAVNAISGNGTIEKHGAGVLTLTGNSTFTGDLKVFAGTLKPRSASGAGDTNSGNIMLQAGSTLDINSVSLGMKAVTVQGAGVNGAGAIISTGLTDQQSALSNVTLTGDTTFGGSARWDIRAINGTGTLNAAGFNLTKVGANRVQLAGLGDTQLGDIAINEGILGFETTTTQGNPSKTITLAPTATIAYFNTGTNAVTKNIVSNGGRFLDENGTIVQAGTILLNADSIVEGAGGSMTFTSVISGAGGLIKNGTSDIILNGFNTYTGGTSINAGFLRGNVDGLQGNIVINVTGTGTGAVYQNTADGVSRAIFSGPGNLFAGAGLGTNVVTLTNANTYTGLTALNSGAFRLANANALGGATVGTYIDGGGRTGQVQLSNNITVANEYLGMVGRADGNNAAHLLNFSGNNTWTGTVATALAAESSNATGVGNLYVLESAAGTLNVAGNVVNNLSGAPGTNLANLRLQGDATGIITGSISGTAVGSWNVNKAGNGTWTLAGPANNYTGATLIDGGTLKVTSSIATSSGVTVNNNGVNTPGIFETASVQTVKTLTVNDGASALVSAGVLKVGDNNNPAPLNLTGSAKVDLTTRGLVVDVPAGSETSTLQSVRGQIITAFNTGGPAWQGNGITSSTAATNSSAAVGYALASEVLPFTNGTSDTFLGATVDQSSVVARYTLAGDATLDGAVDFNDLVKLAQNYNTTVSSTTESWWNHGDFTYDGIVDFNDLVKLAQNYNTALPTQPIPGAPIGFDADLAKAFASVPEPGALGFLVATGLVAMGRRRRRAR